MNLRNELINLSNDIIHKVEMVRDDIRNNNHFEADVKLDSLQRMIYAEKVKLLKYSEIKE